MDFDTIRDNIQSGVYDNKVPYPTIKTHMKPRISKESKYYEQVMAEYEEKTAKRKEAMLKYRSGETEAYNKFKTDVVSMFKDSGATNAQCEKAWEMAYDSHSGGHLEVLKAAEEIAELCSLIKQKIV